MKIAFYKGKKKIFNRLVSWWTKGPYSHVELVIYGNACFSSSMQDGGVRFKQIDLTDGNWDVFELPGDYSAEDAYHWFANHLGAKYDLLGLVGFVNRSENGEKDKYFCSEAVAEALGMHECWRYDPNTLFAILKPKLTTISESDKVGFAG